MGSVIGMILFGLGFIVRILGGLAMLGLLVFGVYSLFATSAVVGLLLIGASVVGSWILTFATGVLFVAGAGASALDGGK